MIIEKKARILYVLKYLKENSDEDNLVSTNDLVKYIESLGIETHRITIAEDIEVLKDFGVDIIKIKSSPNKYFIGNRDFEFPELKLLVDAVQSSKFITSKKSEELIEKILKLTSKKKADVIKKGIYFNQEYKPINEKIYYTIDQIQNAIRDNKKISFKYLEYTPIKERQYKHDGYIYELSPYNLFWGEDHYYVIGYSKKHHRVVNLRVDRMDKLEVMRTKAKPMPEEYNASNYTCEVFSMYTGLVKTVELQCENSLMDVIIDRFGEDVKTNIIDDEHFNVIVDVSVSPNFYSWVFQFSGRVKILSPETVVNQMHDMAMEFI